MYKRLGMAVEIPINRIIRSTVGCIIMVCVVKVWSICLWLKRCWKSLHRS